MTEKRGAACRCGSTLSISWSPPDAAVDRAFAWFWREHDGEGHGPATLAQAGVARRKAERALLEDVQP